MLKDISKIFNTKSIINMDDACATVVYRDIILVIQKVEDSYLANTYGKDDIIKAKTLAALKVKIDLL